MKGQPFQVTILRDSSQVNSFTIVTRDYAGDPSYEWLCFDEMLGWIARAFCPTMDDGTPNRAVGKPLFLPAPKRNIRDVLKDGLRRELSEYAGRLKDCDTAMGASKIADDLNRLLDATKSAE